MEQTQFNEQQIEDVCNSIIDSVSFDIFKDPHILNCGHTFSKFVLDEILSKSIHSASCPICRNKFTVLDYRINSCFDQLVKICHNLLNSVKLISFITNNDEKDSVVSNEMINKLNCQQIQMKELSVIKGEIKNDKNNIVTYENLENPYMLHCGHTFSKSIIDNLWNAENNCVCCPTCHVNFKENQIRKNLGLEEIVNHCKLMLNFLENYLQKPNNLPPFTKFKNQYLQNVHLAQKEELKNKIESKQDYIDDAEQLNFLHQKIALKQSYSHYGTYYMCQKCHSQNLTVTQLPRYCRDEPCKMMFVCQNCFTVKYTY